MVEKLTRTRWFLSLLRKRKCTRIQVLPKTCVLHCILVCCQMLWAIFDCVFRASYSVPTHPPETSKEIAKCPTEMLTLGWIGSS